GADSHRRSWTLNRARKRRPLTMAAFRAPNPLRRSAGDLSLYFGDRVPEVVEAVLLVRTPCVAPGYRLLQAPRRTRTPAGTHQKSAVPVRAFRGPSDIQSGARAWRFVA